MLTRRTLLNSLLAAALVVACFIGSVPAQAYQSESKAKAVEKTFTTGFQVTIRNRSDLAAPFMVAGRLKIQVTTSGSFTGHITQGRDDNGDLLPSVLFHFTDAKPVIDSDGPHKLDVIGQITGHAFNLTIKLADDNYIFGTGTSVGDLSALPGGEIKDTIGGSAVTSDSGNSGDWAGGGVTCAFCYYDNKGIKHCYSFCH